MKKLSSFALFANPIMMFSSLQVPSISLRTVVCSRSPPPTHQHEHGDNNNTHKSTSTSTKIEKTTIDMPIIGLGTYKFKKGSGDASRAVQEALQLKYRHIDTAFIYGGEQTEREIGETLATITSKSDLGDSSSTALHQHIPRSELFLTSKQWRAYHGYDSTLECLNKSLKRLQVDYLDLYLIHWPGPAYSSMSRRKDLMEQSPDGPFVYAKDGHARKELQALRAETWRAMEDSLYEGKCRAIGVSNFTIRHLEALKKTARIWPPAVNQIELHPYNPQTELVAFCRKEGIAVQAYASLGGQDCGKKTWNALGGKLTEREEVKSIAGKYSKTPVQVLLRWATQQGIGVIPKSTNVNHMQMNLEAVSSNVQWGDGDGDGLSENDMELLNTLDQSYIKSSGDSDDCDHNIMKVNEKARLCWVRDPLKMLDFE